MTWKNIIKEDEMRAFGDDSDRHEMESARNRAFDEKREKDGDIKFIISGLADELINRLNQIGDEKHKTYSMKIGEKEIQRKLLDMVEKIIDEHIEYDMSKKTFSGP